MADVDLLLCPCKMKTVGVRQNSPTITCCGCSLKWHVRCVGLHGMSAKEAAKYIEWRCPKCYVLPLEESDFQANDPTLHENIISEVMKILPALVTTVVQETQKQSDKTYASVVKEAQESLIMDCFEKSSATVVAKGMQKIEDDIVEWDRRKCNVIIRNVPECNDESSLQRRDYDMAKVQDILEIQDCKVIVRCVRLGKLSGQESVCRPLLVSFDKPETACRHHGNGKGVKSKDGYWINPDLSKMQREANFRARKFLREAKQRRENKPN